MKFIVAYIEEGDSKIFKSAFVSQLNGNPTLSKGQLNPMKASNFYTNHELLTATNHAWVGHSIRILCTTCGKVVIV